MYWLSDISEKKIIIFYFHSYYLLFTVCLGRQSFLVPALTLGSFRQQIESPTLFVLMLLLDEDSFTYYVHIPGTPASSRLGFKKIAVFAAL